MKLRDWGWYDLVVVFFSIALDISGRVRSIFPYVNASVTIARASVVLTLVICTNTLYKVLASIVLS